ncbi:MAG: hypothetical protein ACOCP8_08175 [archaeon]
MANFIDIANSIFSRNNNYNNFSDKDKKNSFWMLNRKFAINDIKTAKLFNSKTVDHESCIDIWNLEYEKYNSIPKWYWNTSKKSKNNNNNNILKPIEKKLLIENTSLNEKDIEFMEKWYLDELKYEIKKLKRLKQ